MKSLGKTRSLITNWAFNNTAQWNEACNGLTSKLETQQPQLQ